MGRKDLSKVRRNQILDAFELCIIESGLFGTTLTTVAEKAKINRGQIHQYIGDRDALLSALVERLIEGYREGFAAYLEAYANSPNSDSIVEYFFDEWGRADSNDDVIIDALMAESAHNPHLRKLVLDAYSMLEDELAVSLHNLYPNTPMGRCQNVAYAIMSMAYGSSTMIWLGFDRNRLAAVQSSAYALLQTLEENS